MLVLSLFPGIGLLDQGFEEEGFCVVRGPDLLWGGNVKRFNPPAGKFAGVIGGTPCQAHSSLVSLIRHNGQKVAECLIPEFERVVHEAQPEWFLMENVIKAPLPSVTGYQVDPTLLDNRWLGEKQSRLHRFSFGTRDGRRLVYDTVALERMDFSPRVLAAAGGERKTARELKGGRIRKGMPWAESCRLQGLPPDFDLPGFTDKAKRKALGNAVPLPMAREVARAVRRATSLPELAA
jgi:DNA (cytosine-5)-methyltransferase 1